MVCYIGFDSGHEGLGRPLPKYKKQYFYETQASKQARHCTDLGPICIPIPHLWWFVNRKYSIGDYSVSSP